MRGRVLVAVLAGAALTLAACTGSTAPRHSATPSTTATPTPTMSTATPTTPSSTPSSVRARVHTTSTKPKPPRHTTASHSSGPRALPLHLPTSGARQVITVVAPSSSSTYATLQAWRKVTGGWRQVGGSVPARLGSDGLSAHPSEFRSATPIGSFSLTQAFGYYSNPGTRLSYFRTTPADWWISQSGQYYNTHQHCASDCAFTRGSPNEHLYYETPYYNYAVVINTPSGASAYPHGSAFFLHVEHDGATAGCVSIPQDQLLRIMKWLNPAEHPRILIGLD